MTADIYHREDLLEVYRHPMNQGELADADISVVENNLMCGDVIRLDLKIEANKIADAKFSGDACAVSVISSALFTDEIIGKSLDEVKKYTKDDILELIDVQLTTSRIKCATLILEALQSALTSYEQR